MAKSPNPTAKSSKGPKECFDQYLDIFTLRMKPVSVEFIENEGLALLKWAAESKGALKIRQYFKERGIYNNDIVRWRKRSEKFEAAYVTALDYIGDRREIGAITNKYNVAMIKGRMHGYDIDWKDDLDEERKFKASLKPQEGSGDIKVVIESYPGSDAVPARVKPDDT